jgi:secreted PhoX family phosphatase|tara:strand:- start:907 stop:2334 length:1428 start_codon:yes stop_codon:yes gene_type:complete
VKNRRNFLKNLTAVTAGFSGLQRYAEAASRYQGYENQWLKYGELVSDPNRLLDLPKGFTYKVISQKGKLMTDGFLVPGFPDGMAAYPINQEKILLIRNHELSPHQFDEGPFGVINELAKNIDSKLIYDKGSGRPHLGGTTNIVYNIKERLVEQEFLSLVGTARNCAGGPTPWGSWITCEEDVTIKGGLNEKDHGYNFEVPPYVKPNIAKPNPLKDMGRFNHEAIAIDPNSGVVYQTEDREDGLIYRYIPNIPGKLHKGGKLQALFVIDKHGCDLRNWPLEINTNADNLDIIPDKLVARREIEPGQTLDVKWIDMEDIQSPEDDLRYRGHNCGAARFARGEGMWYSDKNIYFACTNGGTNKSGQIFKYTPSTFEGQRKEEVSPGTLTLFVEPNDTKICEYADTLTVAPWGDIIIAEDGPKLQYIRGITPEGEFYTLACNSRNLVEFAGPCFSKYHNSLFVNMQWPGLTLEITGPWT